MPKTGSSSIQWFLYKNREKLKKFDVFYPIIKTNEDELLGLRFVNLRKAVMNVLPYGIEEFNKFFEDNFLSQINENNCSKIILSEEKLFSLKSTDIVDIMLKYGFNVKVIVCLRNPVDFLASQWQENTKPYTGFFNTTIDKYLNEANANYPLILKYIEKLGKDNVIIRPFEKCQWKNGDLIEDFLSVLGVENSDDFEKNEKQNTSYNRDLAEFMLLLKSLKLDKEILTQLVYEYAEYVVPKDELSEYDSNSLSELSLAIEKNTQKNPKVTDTVSTETKRQVIEKYRDVISQIENCYGGERLFKTYNYDGIFEADNQKYDKAELTYEQLKILNKAINYTTANYNILQCEKDIFENELKKIEEETFPFYKNLFSIEKSGNNKVIRIFGFKITLKSS